MQDRNNIRNKKYFRQVLPIDFIEMLFLLIRCRHLRKRRLSIRSPLAYGVVKI